MAQIVLAVGGGGYVGPFEFCAAAAGGWVSWRVEMVGEETGGNGGREMEEVIYRLPSLRTPATRSIVRSM